MRKLQWGLYRAAKQEPERKFHALWQCVTDRHTLREAWQRIYANRGAAGADGETLKAIKDRGVEVFLENLRKDLKAGAYHPQAVRRVYIPKANEKKRPLGIPTVRDRVVQMAVKLVVEPLFEADFEECSYGFRPRRSAVQALEELRKSAPKGLEWAVEADIQSCFDTIDHERLMRRLGLEPAMEKTRIVHLRVQGIDFLGCHLRMAMSRKYPGRWYLYRWPNQKAMAKVRERIHEITACQHGGMRLADVIAELNPVLRGWGEYFRNGNAARKFLVLDRYVRTRLIIFSNRVRGRNHPTRQNEFDYRWYAKLGVFRLMGLIRYPAQKARTA